MNKSAKGVTGLLTMMIVVVATSAIILIFIQAGLISVKASEQDVPLLNAEFVPYVREGNLAIANFQFCGKVDDAYRCIDEKERFFPGEQVHFRLEVESSTYNGEVMIVENYRIKGPDGSVLLDVDEKANFQFNQPSRNRREWVTFKDYFVPSADLPEGKYTLELVLENPLIMKKVEAMYTFALVGEE